MALQIDLSGRRALITGVSSGIGLAIAAVLAEAGCDIAGCALEAADSTGAQAFRDAVRAWGRQGHYAAVDVRDGDALERWVAEAASALGGEPGRVPGPVPVDIVVSNAGRSVFTGALTTTEAQWEDAIGLNLAAHWRVSRAAYPYLQAAPSPVIIVIASNHAYATIPGCFPYNVAKAGLLGLVQSLAIEWGPKVRAVGIAPGFIETPNSAAWFDSFPDPGAERARTVARHPVGRIGTPREIGGLCAFLCSPYSAFISGSTILADGGRSALMQDE